VWANNIPVTPGTTYSVGVGWGGSGMGAAGGNSWFISTETMIAYGGSGGTRSQGAGGSWMVSSSLLSSAGGGVGGSGGWQSWASGTGDAAGGGGGAAGYTGALNPILISTCGTESGGGCLNQSLINMQQPLSAGA